MSEFLFGHRNGIHIIDLQKTVQLFNEALKVVKSFAEEGKTILFVGTKRQASDIIENMLNPVISILLIKDGWVGC